MNTELKKLTRLGIIILVTIVLIINLSYYLNRNHFIPNASRSSQVIHTNRLRRANINRPSEHGRYPNLRQAKSITVVADSQMQKVFILSHQRVIYIMHALVHTTKRHFSCQAQTGQQLIAINGNQAYAAQDWTEFGHHFYFASPVSNNNQTVSGNWLKTNFAFPNSILLSKPDAQWVQTIPKGTKIIVR